MKSVLMVLDEIFHAPAPAIRLVIHALRPPAVHVGHDEPYVFARFVYLDLADHPLGTRPTFRLVPKLDEHLQFLVRQFVCRLYSLYLGLHCAVTPVPAVFTWMRQDLSPSEGTPLYMCRILRPRPT